jgi:hypothetical protein
MLKETSLPSVALKFLGSAAIAVLVTSTFGLPGAVQATEVRQQTRVPPQGSEHFKPTGKGWGERDLTGLTAAQAAKFLRFSTSGISYHGGPVMLNTVNMYYIWYGAWDFTNNADNIATRTLLNTFGSYIGPTPGGTPYFNINTTYYSLDSTSTKAFVSGLVAPPRNATVAGGSSLSDAGVQTVVANAIASGALGSTVPDPNGVYFVLTSKEVRETSGFCTKYCAWHSYTTINATKIKFGFIGNPVDQCPSSCSVQSSTPNANFAGDTMANLIAHELAEAVTDPEISAWWDQRGYENADKCAWTFGATSTASNGSKYNVTLGGNQWLLQQNWINSGKGSCTLSN